MIVGQNYDLSNALEQRMMRQRFPLRFTFYVLRRNSDEEVNNTVKYKTGD